MSASAEVLGYSSHAFDFSRQGIGVKVAVAWPGFLAKILLPQYLSADYPDLDYSIPLTGEALAVASSIEAVGLTIIAASVAAPQYFQLANTINVAPVVSIGGMAIYGAGRAMSLGIEVGNRFFRENKTELPLDLASQMHSIFVNPDSEIICGKKDVAWIFPKTAAEAAAATGLQFGDETGSVAHLFEFKVKNTERAKENETVHNFARLFLDMSREKDYEIAFYAVLNRFDRHRKIYEQLGFEKKAELRNGKQAWVLNPEKLPALTSR